IKGLALLDHSSEGGALGVGPAARTTIVAGATDAPSRIANVRIASTGGATDRVYGILCDRGNAVAPGRPQPPPNFVVDHVVFDNGFGSGLSAATSTTPKSGCNVRVTSSVFKGDSFAPSWVGVVAEACDPDPDRAFTALEIGDGNWDHRNTFQ